MNIIIRLVFIFIVILVLPSCSTSSYYLQGVSGHIALMSQRKPLVDVLKDKNISEGRKEQIKQVQSIRRFAIDKLKLPKNNSYSSFVDIKRDAITWNVIATKKYSIKPIKSCFPFTGCVSYLLYFSQNRAKFEALKHQKQGNDTYIIASPAYSTGGKFDDPIVSTMFKGGITGMAQTVFHELAHQRLHRKGDSSFNEAFASTIGEQGTKLWLKENHPDKVKGYEDYLRKKALFYRLIFKTQAELSELYKEKETKIDLVNQKNRIFQELKTNYIQLKKTWGGDKRFDSWFNRGELNNAKLAVIGVYYKRVPELTQKLKELDVNFETFYQFYEKDEAKK